MPRRCLRGWRRGWQCTSKNPWPPRRHSYVRCRPTSSATVPALKIGSEGVATGLLRSTDGALVQLGLDYVARRPLRRYQLVGELGTLIWDLPRQELILETPAQKQQIDCGPEGFDVAATYPAAMAAFVTSLTGQVQPVLPLQDGLASAALAIRLKELAWPNH